MASLLNFVNMSSLFPALPHRRSLRKTENIQVGDKEGCLCHVALDADFKLTPQQMLEVFSHPGNPGIFRDIHAVPHCELVRDDGDGKQHLVMEQVSRFKFLPFPVTVSAMLDVEKNATTHTYKYRLNKQGRMKKLSGNWSFTPIYSEDDDGKVIGSRATLEQDMTPSYLPPFGQGVFREINKRAMRRMVEDIHGFADKYHDGMPFFEPLEKKNGETKLLDGLSSA